MILMIPRNWKPILKLILVNIVFPYHFAGWLLYLMFYELMWIYLGKFVTWCKTSLFFFFTLPIAEGDSGQENLAKLKEQSEEDSSKDCINSNHRSLFQLLTESKIKFEKINPAKLNSSIGSDVKNESKKDSLKVESTAKDVENNDSSRAMEEAAAGQATPMDTSDESKPKKQKTLRFKISKEVKHFFRYSYILI